MTKQELRKIVRASKREVSLEDKILRSQAIMQKVESLPAFVKADTVLLYWSMDDEVHTHDFVPRWYEKKTILLPCVDGDDLLLRRYTGADSMVPGPQFGIPEPVGPVFNDLDAIDMIVVPGVAFDRQRNRMGRGRGFYDRLLKSTNRAVKVGVAFDFQIFDAIPVEPFDVTMNAVVAETQTF
ncbi:MAG: 5-formyltetrahydrofolate cyclo-ligase [Bacteroidales bacterium]|nr:5-formyltetrahydrofolate cyclo-ligase [Bacteroidales bacterium]